ncbi:iron-regulated protein [Nostoc linckia z16]|nr:iron-regulated protein [Nostoc linckia z16]
MKAIHLSFVLIFTLIASAQEKSPYEFYTSNGKKADYGDVLKAAAGVDVVFFGELHDNSVVHWLQLELTKDVAQKKPLVLGAEMIEADNQQVLDRYLAGEITQKALDTLARLWPNYKTDYKPLVDLAKQKQFRFIATNIPRMYASAVYKNGFEALEALPVEQKQFIAPLPIAYDANLPGYKAMLAMAGGHGGDNLPKAQAVKDATMAWFISKAFTPGSIFVHYNGSYHSDNNEGIIWYLRRLQPNLKIMAIAAVQQPDITSLKPESKDKGTYILVIDEDVTKTH